MGRHFQAKGMRVPDPSHNFRVGQSDKLIVFACNVMHLAAIIERKDLRERERGREGESKVFGPIKAR